MSFTWLAAAVGCLALTGLAGCTGENEGSACGDVESGVTTLTIHLGTNADGSMYQTPKDLQAAMGAKVRFMVVNDDKTVFHDFAVLNLFGDGQKLEHEVDGGKTVCTTHDGEPYFTADKKGDYQTLCEVSGHKELGMKGTFKVV